MNQIFITMRLRNRDIPLEDKAFYHLSQGVIYKGGWYYSLLRKFTEQLCP